jgi:hypothetical protein
MKKSSKKNSCKKGEILRASYVRKAHSRKSSLKRTVKIKKTYVPSACVPAKGKALSRGSKTPEREKVLPKLGNDVHLSKYGYATNKSITERHTALKSASIKHGDLVVLRRLNAIRNYQADPKAKSIMSNDVKYLSLRHAKRLEQEGKKSHSIYKK